MNKNQTTTTTATAKELAKLIAYSKSVASIDAKKYAELFESIEEVRKTFALRHQAIEQGKATEETQNACYTALRKVFAIIGKVNGFNLTATATTDAKASRNIFDDCIRFLRKDKTVSTSAKMASLLGEKKELAKKIATAKEQKQFDKMIELEEQAKAIAEDITALKLKEGNQKTIDIYAKPKQFAKDICYCLSLAINYQLTLTEEQIKDNRNAKNKQRKENRKGKAEEKTATEDKKTATQVAKKTA